jgi:copper transport protein
MAGAFVFVPLVWRRRGLALRPPEVEERFSARWRLLLLAGWTAVLLATLVAFVFQGAVGGGVSFLSAMSPRVLGEVMATRFGMVHAAKLGLLVAAAGVWLAARRTGSVPLVSRQALVTRSLGSAAVEAPVPTWFLGLGAAILVGLLATPSLSGHAGVTRPVPVNLVADVVHLLAVSTWIGGLVCLLGLTFPATRSLGEAERVRAMAPVVARFSRVAFFAVGVLVASGIVRSFLEVRALRALTGSTYGLVLLAKLAAFLPIFALGAVNRYWTTPRLERAAAADGSPFPLRTLRRLVTAEVLLAAVVLAITAFLVVLPPARIEAGVEGPFVTEVAVGDQRLEVMVDPNRAGMNTLHLSLTTAEGLPGEAEEIRVLFRMTEQGIGPIEAMAMPISHGAFELHGHQLSVPGSWLLEFVVLADRFTEHRATVKVNVNP